MTKFEEWWDAHKTGYVATPLMERCFDAGFDEGMEAGFLAMSILKWVIAATAAVLIAWIFRGLV